MKSLQRKKALLNCVSLLLLATSLRVTYIQSDNVILLPTNSKNIYTLAIARLNTQCEHYTIDLYP